jgi:hypothetical protein
VILGKHTIKWRKQSKHLKVLTGFNVRVSDVTGVYCNSENIRNAKILTVFDVDAYMTAGYVGKKTMKQ